MPPNNGTAAETDALTLEAALKRGTDFLRGLGIEAARLEMELLLAHTLATNRLGLYLNLQRQLTPEERERSRELIARRREREPMAYILGAKEFHGLRFRVTRDVLIPRPETEHLVDRAIEIAGELEGEGAEEGKEGEEDSSTGTVTSTNGEDGEGESKSKSKSMSMSMSKSMSMSTSMRTRKSGEILCLDIGTGSGAIAVAAAARQKASGSGAKWIATDASEAALEIARENARANEVEDRIEFRAGDLLGPIAEEADLICANLPYVPEGDREGLAPEVAKWEPAGALFSGEAGLDHIARLIGEAGGKLKPGGVILMEFGFGQKESIRMMMEASGQFEAIGFHADLAGIPRVAEGRKGRP